MSLSQSDSTRSPPKEDNEEEFLTTDVNDSGMVRVVRGAKDGRLPQGPEDLRAKHRVRGLQC